MGEPDKVILRAKLEGAGWKVSPLERDEWWLHEAWMLTSTWRPVGAEVHLTMVIDPQINSSGIENVWAICVGRSSPMERLAEDQTTVRTSPCLPERLEEIVAAARALRPAF